MRMIKIKWYLGDHFTLDKSEIFDEEIKILPQSERHRVEAPFHLTEEYPRCLHL